MRSPRRRLQSFQRRHFERQSKEATVNVLDRSDQVGVECSKACLEGFQIFVGDRHSAAKLPPGGQETIRESLTAGVLGGQAPERESSDSDHACMGPGTGDQQLVAPDYTARVRALRLIAALPLFVGCGPSPCASGQAPEVVLGSGHDANFEP